MKKNKISTRIDLQQQSITGYLFVFPIVFLLVGLIIYPMIYGIYISFFNTNLVNRWDFVGLQYYISAITDSDFYGSVGRTFIFMVLVVAGHFFIGMLLATLLNRDFRGRTGFRVLFTMPWFLPEAVVALLFSWILNPLYGVLNHVLVSLGVIETNLSWLGNKDYAFITVVLICIWKGFPLVMTMVLAGLQGIATDYYEAARIDGASAWQSFKSITIPMLRPILKTVLILDSVWWFKQYTLVYTMTSGGPGTTTSLVSLSIYSTAFNDLRFGKGAAWGVIVFGICYLISLVYKVVLKDND
ncbi:MAG: sugar ABC transporter permease [Eubacteriales bacterium]